MEARREFICFSCGHKWSLPFGTGRPPACPKCGGVDIARSDPARGLGRGRRQGAGRGYGRGQGRREGTT